MVGCCQQYRPIIERTETNVEIHVEQKWGWDYIDGENLSDSCFQRNPA